MNAKVMCADIRRLNFWSTGLQIVQKASDIKKRASISLTERKEMLRNSHRR